MGSLTKEHHHQPLSLAKKFLPWAIYALFPVAIFRLCFYPLSLPLPHPSTTLFTSSSPPPKGVETHEAAACDYTDGRWVSDKFGALYNGTSCGTIKEGQNCMSHGRADMGYLHWRWSPNHCSLPRFDPKTFLDLFRHKHIGFVGDSMARNQLESLLCMLSTVSSPNLVYTDGEESKFRRWHFDTHNIIVSVYWSPFLVNGIEKSNSGEGLKLNRLDLDRIDERWASDLGHIDLVVLSVGHWFLHQAVFHEGDSVMGCHFCAELGFNHTEVPFYDALRKALRTTLKTIIERQGGGDNKRGIDVLLTTFSPAHFEGEWDKAGACPKTKPFEEGERALEGMDAEMRQIEVEEVESAKVNAKNSGSGLVRVEALDVTKLSLMRPDGHPGPYMYPFSFANGVPERVQNDCVHWCLPGPIDTWNEILLDVMKRWHWHAQ